jgi:hypothetical protein
MSRLTPNMIGAALIGAATSIYLFEAVKLPFGGLSAPDIGFMPRTLAWIVLGLCLILFLNDALRHKPLRKNAPQAAQAASTEPPAGKRRGLAVMAALLFYPLALPFLGFLATSTITMLTVFRTVRYRGWLGSLVIALVSTGIYYLILGIWAGVHFPSGWFGLG